MTLTSPAWQLVDYLLSLPSATLDQFVDQDPGVVPEINYGRLIFRDALPVKINNTGLRALVCSNSGPSYYGRTRGVGGVVTVRSYADHDRPDIAGTPAVENGIDRAFASAGFVLQLLDTDRTLRTVPLLQVSRVGGPLEGFDQAVNLPYVACTFDVATLVAA